MSRVEPLDQQLLARIRRVTGKSPEQVSVLSGRGYTAALRLRIVFTDGTSLFVKAATDADTARWLFVEKNVYRALSSHRFLPTCHGFGEAEQTEQFPFLVLEDLSGAHWPPPWTPHQIDAVLETLSDIHRVRDAFVETLLPVEVAEAQTRTWDAVAADPAPFLSLHFCSETWLAAALPTLLSAATAVPLSGDSLLHLDVRSDNICHRPEDDRAVFVDWNWVCRGNPDLDIAAWLPSLQNEGGPLPETILPDAAELAAWLSGFWAAQAGMPPLPTAPRVRAVQKQQLRTALPWAARALSLPPLDTPL